MTPIRILVVDDHTLFREGMCAILDNVPDIEVVGQACDGHEAVEQAKTLRPDIVLMDVSMPNLNGLEATVQVLAHKPDTGIIMLTMIENNDSLFAAMRAGARGYILKGADKAEMLKTIRSVAEGGATFGPAIATRLTAFFQSSHERPQLEPADPFPDLTNREREVLELVAAGQDNQTIANRLHISIKTVSNHISNIFNKLQVADRVQAVVKARQAGMGES